eukprot:TRINITY_DN1607_c2_g1_i3.p1 TRINITY_DN1607_c2_g1~~TRINITY_DN1607_c2_g1_i3.p1  ORF type:complete len:180 (+),score=3.34 TRINITY_DN1607_c2_g1_i3:268-807(+)
MLSREVYSFMNDQATWMSFWIMAFACFTVVNLYRLYSNPKEIGNYGTNTFLSEGPGLPLSLLHTACFVIAIQHRDFLSVLLFSWWGPGFIVVAAWYLYIKKYKIKFDWSPLGLITSYGCKINYLLYVLIYFYYGMYHIIYVFSIWVIHDLINLGMYSIIIVVIHHHLIWRIFLNIFSLV